jgi:hypothetical protein
MTVKMLNGGSVAKVKVHRQAAVDASHHTDIVVDADGRCLAVIEVKVLAGLGPLQLDGYASAVPEAGAYLVVFPQSLTIDLAGAPRWQGVSWETLLDKSTDPATPSGSPPAPPRGWSTWIASCPRWTPTPVWNDLVEGEDFVVALRTRMSWVHGQLAPPPSARHDLVSSAADTSRVARMYTDAQAPGYRVVAEAEENLPVWEFPKFAGPGQRQPRRPGGLAETRCRIPRLLHAVAASGRLTSTGPVIDPESRYSGTGRRRCLSCDAS